MLLTCGERNVMRQLQRVAMLLLGAPYGSTILAFHWRSSALTSNSSTLLAAATAVYDGAKANFFTTGHYNKHFVPTSLLFTVAPASHHILMAVSSVACDKM